MNHSLASAVPRSGGLVQGRESTEEEDARAYHAFVKARFDRQQEASDGIAAAAAAAAETTTIRPSQATSKNVRHNEGKIRRTVLNNSRSLSFAHRQLVRESSPSHDGLVGHDKARVVANYLWKILPNRHRGRRADLRFSFRSVLV